MLQNLRVKQKLGLLVFIFILGFFVFAAFTYYGFNLVKVNGPIYKNIIQGKDVIADVLPPPEYIIESYLLVYEIVNEKNTTKLNELISRSEKLREEYNVRHQLWIDELSPGELKDILTINSYTPAIEFFKIRDEQFIPAVLAGDYEAASLLIQGPLKENYEEHRLQIDKVVTIATQRNSTDELKATDTVLYLITILLLLGAFVICSTLIIWYFITKSFRPLDQITLMLKDIAEGEGDLTKRIKITTNDEIGDMAKFFNIFIGKIHDVMLNIKDVTLILNNSSKILLQTANRIQDNNVQTNDKSMSVNASIEEITASIENESSVISESSKNMQFIKSSIEHISSTIQNIATSSEQTASGVKHTTLSVSQISTSIDVVSESSKDVASSVNNLALAVKEINYSLNEVSRNCVRSIQITADASSQAKSTNTIIEELNKSSRLIGKIISLIDDIADQTNMLALNAAIEAAGAGDAGKGFAVVANEVKELAKQTAEATEEISQQVDTMQKNILGAVNAISSISDVIEETKAITNTIAAAVSEQSATTGQILNIVVKASEKVNHINQEIIEIASNSQNSAKNMSEATTGVDGIANSVIALSSSAKGVASNIEQISSKMNSLATTSDEISIAVNEISKDVQEVTTAVASSVNSAEGTGKLAKDLSTIAGNLDQLVRSFRV